MTAEELSALHKNCDEAIAKAVKAHQIAIDNLTEQQVVQVFKQAIECGDISINVVVPERFGQIRQGAMYIPFAEKERLESRIKELERELADERQKRTPERRFPIQRGPSVPWSVMEPHESMAQANHYQSIQRLSERGGLSPGEAWCVVSGIWLRGSEQKEQWDEYERKWREFAERVNLHYVELDAERQKREQAERAAAVMREALQAVVDFGTCERVGKITCNENRAATNGAGEQCVYCQCEEALRGDAGRDWVPADRFKEVVEALEAIRDKADPYTHQIHWCRETARKALARAKEVK